MLSVLIIDAKILDHYSKYNDLITQSECIGSMLYHIPFIDKLKMQRVFLNLINNAIEAIGENGVINISLENNENKFILWKIKDSGCGISDEIASRIFEPFVSGKSNGTGLGMSIVKSFVEKHGGSISVNSKIGEGTEMIISLPKSVNV